MFTCRKECFRSRACRRQCKVGIFKTVTLSCDECSFTETIMVLTRSSFLPDMYVTQKSQKPDKPGVSPINWDYHFDKLGAIN